MKDKYKKSLELEHSIIKEHQDYEFPPMELLTRKKEENDSRVEYIDNIIESNDYFESDLKALISLKDEKNNVKLINIYDTSHILIAGTTGIGKTTLLDDIIIGTIYKAKPSEVKFVMIDTKRDSLRLYNGIPNLLIPVITDTKKSIGVLAWIVQEINNRNDLMREKDTENILEYNKKSKKRNEGKLPTILILIDEISEIISYDRENVDRLLKQITQMGKKVGVFLIMVTNRPSSDIISGTVKANIYTRISFFLPSKLDSRLILDIDGAEKLNNYGDMLLKTLGSVYPQKYHCPYVLQDTIKDVVDFAKSNHTVAYDEDILETIDNNNKTDKERYLVSEQALDDDIDPFLEEAITEVIKTGQASTSFIQRRFKIGYERAGRIIDQMEERGVISGYQGSKPREVLWTLEKLQYVNNK